MSDDLFSKLFELFNQPGKVNWPLGKEAARNLAGESEPLDPWLVDEYEQLFRVAQLTLTAGDAPTDFATLPDPTLSDARTWAEANLRAFEYVADPLADKLSSQPLLGPMAAAMLGMQMGALIGTMSRHIVGSFEAPLPVAAMVAPTILVPNVEAMISESGIDQHEARLWVTFTELVNRRLWERSGVRDRFAHLLDRYVAGLELPDMSILERLGDLQDPTALQNLLEEPGGVTGLTKPDELDPLVDQLVGVQGIVTGYTAYVVEKAAADVLPNRDAIRGRLRLRADENESRLVLQQMLALELEDQQDGRALEFCRAVEERWGAEGLDKLWIDSENLPTGRELSDPIGWAARVLVEDIGL